VDKKRLIRFKEGELVIANGYLKLDGSTVHLTVSEYIILCTIFDTYFEGVTIADISIGLNAFVSDISSLVNSHVHTTRKKLASLSSNQIIIKWNRSTKTYHLLVL
jgi:DNA-binding response OmpR family regulator